jgi:hypothetical protein
MLQLDLVDRQVEAVPQQLDQDRTPLIVMLVGCNR